MIYNLIRASNAAMAQSVERVLGKDEVPGPNPGSSSNPQRFIFGDFLLYFQFSLFTETSWIRKVIYNSEQ